VYPCLYLELWGDEALSTLASTFLYMRVHMGARLRAAVGCKDPMQDMGLAHIDSPTA